MPREFDSQQQYYESLKFRDFEAFLSFRFLCIVITNVTFISNIIHTRLFELHDLYSSLNIVRVIKSRIIGRGM